MNEQPGNFMPLSTTFTVENIFIVSVIVDILKCGAWWWMCSASAFSSLPVHPCANN
jgi:hypothetical protein